MLNVRDATIVDRDRLSALGETTYRSHFTAIWSPERLESYIASEYSPAALERSLGETDRSLWLIAELGGEAIGFAKLNWNRPLPVDERRIGTELQKIYFRAGQTGLGHGRAMLEAIVARVKARGPLLWLDVLKSNEAARGFYERNGFRSFGEIPFATDLREIGMWVMARDV